jgi:hypothetical protein
VFRQLITGARRLKRESQADTAYALAHSFHTRMSRSTLPVPSALSLRVAARAVAGDRLFETIKLNQDHGLIHPQLVGLSRLAQDQKAAARVDDCWLSLCAVERPNGAVRRSILAPSEIMSATVDRKMSRVSARTRQDFRVL